MKLPDNPITTEKLKAALVDVIDLDYEAMHPRWQRAYADYEHSIRVLLAFREADDARSGQVP
jgi:hypothetical protein